MLGSGVTGAYYIKRKKMGGREEERQGGMGKGEQGREKQVIHVPNVRVRPEVRILIYPIPVTWGPLKNAELNNISFISTQARQAKTFIKNKWMITTFRTSSCSGVKRGMCLGLP